jgi:FkbM family methyltransferase
LRLAYPGSAVPAMVGDYGDLHILEEVLVQEQYRQPEVAAPEVIFDLGSNIGLTLLYFTTRHRSSRIFGFEPNPAVLEMLRENTAKWPNIQVREVAIADRDGTADLFAGAFSSSASLFPPSSERDPVPVATRTLETAMREAGVERIDLLKMDIEGSEWQVLRSAAFRERVDAVVAEVHPRTADDPRQLLEEALTDFDWELTEIDADHAIVSGVRHPRNGG